MNDCRNENVGRNGAMRGNPGGAFSRGVTRGKNDDTYEEPKTMNLPGMTVRVYRPVLDEAERRRRMKEIEKRAARLLQSEWERRKS